MAAFHELIDLDGVVVSTVLTGDNRHYLIDGPKLAPIDEIVAYCLDCKNFVASERLLTAEHLNARVDWTSTLVGDERDYWEFIYGSLQDMLKTSKESVARFKLRCSLPKCMDCGSTNILQEELDAVGVETNRLMLAKYLPAGLSVKFGGWANTDTPHRLFNLECEEIELPDEEYVDLGTTEK